MPRGVKRTVSYRIAEIDAKIQKNQSEIKKLQAQRKDLESTHQAEVAAQIIQTASQKGISLEDVLASINSK